MGTPFGRNLVILWYSGDLSKTYPSCCVVQYCTHILHANVVVTCGGKVYTVNRMLPCFHYQNVHTPYQILLLSPIFTLHYRIFCRTFGMFAYGKNCLYLCKKNSSLKTRKIKRNQKQNFFCYGSFPEFDHQNPASLLSLRISLRRSAASWRPFSASVRMRSPGMGVGRSFSFTATITENARFTM